MKILGYAKLAVKLHAESAGVVQIARVSAWFQGNVWIFLNKPEMSQSQR